MLTPKTLPNTENRLLTKGLASYIVGNYELGEMYDEFCQVVAAMGGPDLGMVAQQMMAMTGQPGQGGQAPVDLRNEVFGQFMSPLTLIQQVKKPYDSRDAISMLIAVGVRDGRVLDRAVGRIHHLFLAKSDPELRREMLNTSIYVLPATAGYFMLADPMDLTPDVDDDGERNQMAFAVVGDHLVLGTVPVVEQAVRDVGRTDKESLDADAMYRYARRFLPGEAGAMSYENERLTSGVSWAMLKAAAAREALEPKNEAAAAGDDGTTFENEISLGMSTSSLGLLVEQLKGMCDFTMLPEYETVEQYFGCSVGYMVGRDDGIYLEAVRLKAPADLGD